MSLEVFDVIREAAKADDGTALLMPFDGTLFIEYRKAWFELVGIVDDEKLLLLSGTWEEYDPATIACIERAWCSRNLSQGLVVWTMMDVMSKMPADASEQRGLMRTIIKNWSCLQHMEALTNG